MDEHSTGKEVTRDKYSYDMGNIDRIEWPHIITQILIKSSDYEHVLHII